MEETKSRELEKWESAKNMMAEDYKPLTFGPYFSHIIRRSPRRLLHLLSYYKFAAKMIGNDKKVMDVGCSEGFGSVILAEFAREFVGVDIDAAAISHAQGSLGSAKVSFKHADFLKADLGVFDAVTCFDVIEHIYPENEDTFLSRITAHLNSDGMAVVGTPSITSDQFASPWTKEGHVNLYSGERLKTSLERHFKKVVIFSANDEVVHTGFWPMAHYLIGVGMFKK
ncbi:MAG: methyltransferase type 11 [Proteobacteria bacterium SG_bin7]|nr:MAG: methyltransferase type 11 [Proteobacteria bacterium SG_bin7]